MVVATETRKVNWNYCLDLGRGRVRNNREENTWVKIFIGKWEKRGFLRK